MTEPSRELENVVEKKADKKVQKSAFSVEASPFNAIKLELAILLLLGFVFWLVLDSITNSDLTQIIILLIYSMLGSIWLAVRIRRVLQQSVKR